MARIYRHGYDLGVKGGWLGIFSNVILFIFKITAGILGRSQAMIADSFHTASDILTSVSVVVGFKIASKPADKQHPFGHGRAEAISAKIVAIVLVIIGLKIAHTSAKVLISGHMSSPGLIALVAAVVSIIIKEFVYRKVIKASTEINSVSLKADGLHHRSDVLSSIAALVGIMGARMGHYFMDPLAGIIVAGFVIKMGVDVLHEAWDELMDAAPSLKLVEKIEDIITKVDGVDSVKETKIRKAGIEFFVESVICVDGKKTVEEGHIVTIKIKRAIFKEMPSVKDVVVHVEPC